MTALVRGESARSSRSGVSFQPSSSRVSTSTGVAPNMRTCSGYVTQYGLGMTTSSPGSKSARARLKSACFAPTLTQTFFGSGRQPRAFSVASQMASLSAGMPVTAVYLEQPASMAFFAASRTAAGGSKSGSPTPNANTSTPRARSSIARAFIASVMLGATALNREASE